ncbi:MAG: TatD family hydrolase, partial [Dehalococcoidia bacterium]
EAGRLGRGARVTTPLFDSHCHLQDAAFGGELDGVIERARAAGVVGVLNCADNAESVAGVLETAARYEGVWAATGFHPHEADTVTARQLAELESVAALESVVAIGEIGLDFYRNHSTPANQGRVLERQLEIAVRTGLPVSVHSRAAEDEIFELLEPYARATRLRPAGVMHCFGGSVEQANRYVGLGFLISVACTVTYPKNARGRQLARELPLDALLVETDAPYLPPQGQRGQRNEPANVAAAVASIAEAREVQFETVAEATTANALRLLRLPIPAGAAR